MYIQLVNIISFIFLFKEQLTDNVDIDDINKDNNFYGFLELNTV